MGTSSTIYARDRRTDDWKLVHADATMSKFKHVAMTFALRRRLTDCKAVYLYRGRRRVAKGECSDYTFRLTFVDSSETHRWFDAGEQLIDYDVMFISRAFANRFNIHSKTSHTAVYRTTHPFPTPPQQKTNALSLFARKLVRGMLDV